jgi:hypothetical protein
MPKTSWGILFLFSFLLFVGCSVSTQVTNTPRPNIEQRLLARSLERAPNAFATESLKGKIVVVDLYGLTPPTEILQENFAPPGHNENEYAALRIPRGCKTQGREVGFVILSRV